MARPRQPIDLIVAKGKKNLTKEEINERKSKEIKANNDNIQAPSYLPEMLKEEFIRVSDELNRIGIMSNLDCEALARYLIAEYQYQSIVLKALNTDISSEAYGDLLLRQEKLFKMSRQAAIDLGLTISSRCKLVIPTGNKENEEKKETMEDAMFGGQV